MCTSGMQQSFVGKLPGQWHENEGEMKEDEEQTKVQQVHTHFYESQLCNSLSTVSLKWNLVCVRTFFYVLCSRWWVAA